MTKPKEDYGKAYQVELRRLGLVLLSREVEAGGRARDFTDRQLTMLLRNISDANPAGCWMWLGPCNNRGGYGQCIAREKDSGKSKPILAHRAVYQLTKGPIPDGMTLDHLCRAPGCVNPDHLDPCDAAENTARSPLTITSINRSKEACEKGHPFVTRKRDSRDSRTRRACMECAAENARARLRQFGTCTTRCEECGRQCARQRRVPVDD